LPFYYHFDNIFQTIKEFYNDNEIIIAIIFSCLVIFLIVIVAFLIYKSKNNMTSEYGTYRNQTPEPKKQEESVQQDVNKDPIVPIKAAEMGTSNDISVQQPSPADSPQQSKTESGLAVVFQYRVQAGDERPESYFNQQITKRIDATNIPASSVGVPYELVLDFTPLARDLKIFDSKPNIAFGNRGFEVIAEGNKMTIKGTPRDSVDAPLSFCFKKEGKKIKDAGQDEVPYFQYPKPFLINPHPRDLWQNLPVTDYEGYQNRDSDARGETIDYILAKRGVFSTTPPKSLEVIAASQRGRSHAHVGKPRDDCFHFEFDEKTGWNFVAVADGAGSAKFSRKGSELACHTVISSLRTNLRDEINTVLPDWITDTLQKRKNNFEQPMFSCNKENRNIEIDKLGNIFHNAVYAAYMAIHEESQKRKAETKDYHTTLLCAAFRYFEKLKCWFIISYWVGDGGAAILRWNEMNRVWVLGEPDGGEFAGQTKFLTMKDEITAEAIHKRLRFSFCETFETMLFVTDGITDPFFPSEAAVADEQRWLEFYEQKLKNGCEEEPNGCPALFDATKTPQQKADALLHWLDFWSKGNHDDRTILIVKDKENNTHQQQ
ncbi:MAG: protein phosphatase 2C domain-containing protein, partial [Planctomycetaceae bacterium]|nr:protein phosphatase 2C domain-containing protein [Planctomycetaceae bacterium]